MIILKSPVGLTLLAINLWNQSKLLYLSLIKKAMILRTVLVFTEFHFRQQKCPSPIWQNSLTGPSYSRFGICWPKVRSRAMWTVIPSSRTIVLEERRLFASAFSHYQHPPGGLDNKLAPISRHLILRGVTEMVVIMLNKYSTGVQFTPLIA